MKHATPEATREYFAARPSARKPRQLGRTGLWVSPVGFGAYRVDEEDPSHRAALRMALDGGCNLIDTSSNYTGGASERAIGRVLREWTDGSKGRREQVVVVTKAGYVQGENLQIAREREAAGQPFAEMVKISDGLWHCLSPEFLEDQITRSLDRLGLGCLDVLLLHNPEYFLQRPGASHAEYYERIERALAHLEKETQRGRIRCYGISSNGFPEAREAEEFTSLASIGEIVDRLGPDARFAVVELPFNLLEAGAVFDAAHDGRSAVEFAGARNWGVLTNRPFNAFFGRSLVRLADAPSHHGREVEEELQDAFQRAMELESSYPGRASVPAAEVAWAHTLRKHFEGLLELDTWSHTLRWQIRPRLAAGLRTLRTAGHAEWADHYSPAAEALFAAFTRLLETDQARRALRLSSAMDRAAPELRASGTLTRRAVRAYLSFPGVTSVLAGMRRPEYVADLLREDAPLGAEQALDAIEAVLEEIDAHTEPDDDAPHGHA
jgi:hypothetical protein